MSETHRTYFGLKNRIVSIVGSFSVAHTQVTGERVYYLLKFYFYKLIPHSDLAATSFLSAYIRHRPSLHQAIDGLK